MVTIQFEHIKLVQHNIGNGITEPKLAYTDGDSPVVIKTYNGPEGYLVLFNEYFCYRLAALLDIQMPISGVCLLDDKTLVYNDCVNKNQLGYGFYSSYLSKATTLVETIVPMIKNRGDFLKILLFDHVIYNSDRNAGNLLVQYYKKDISLYVIDHSHVFINQAVWDSNCLQRAIEEKDYFSTSILEENSYLYEMFYRHISIKKKDLLKLAGTFSEKITSDKLSEFIGDMPKEWHPSQKDIDALIYYILYRTEHLEDICSTIIAYLSK